MDTSNLKKTQTTIVSELNTIFGASSLAAAFRSPNFQTLVEKQLNILAFLERKHKSKTIDSVDLLNKYNTLSGKHFNIDTNITYTNDTALIDDANYLNIYLKNIYKVDVQALANGTKADIPNLTVNDAPGQGPAVGGMPFAMGGMMGGMAPVMQNQMMAAMAQAKIQQQAAAGEVYLYKSKPKYIPILK
ncbi:hypothetical protein FACS1894166_06770 [Bacilli bacterium]|nr:hypothetical protein FACS1894166_06770 [Bacilli bacterium]